MENKKIWSVAIIDALLTGAYVAAVATFMTYANNLFGQADNVLGGVTILILLVLSAVIVGALVLGRPLMLYLDGKKSEGIKTLLYTILSLFIIFVIFLIVLLIIK